MITQTVERFNYETGEIVEKQNTILRKESKEEYVRFFINSIAGIVGAKLTGSEHNVLYVLQQYTINNSNLILYNPAVRENIAKTLGLKPETVKKAVDKLVKANIVERPKRGMYYLNPIHFGRGDWKNIKKLRKEIIFEYDFDSLSVEKIQKSTAFYEDEEVIKEAITDAEIVHKESVNIDHKTTETTYILNTKRPSFIGSMNGKIGDIDAKAAKKEMIEAKANKTK